MTDSTLPPLVVRGHVLKPVVQGGMGVGISAHQLAGTVARDGAVGTIASVDLRHLHPDLVEASLHAKCTEDYDRLNLIALDREIKRALEIADGEGLVSVNVMKAVDAHAKYVRQACESGAQAITMGAGLPLDLPDMVSEHPNVALLPILSESRGIGIVLKRWMKKNRLPDAIVIEHPAHAGGHLGAAKREEKRQANAKADPGRCTQALNCLSVCGLRDGISKIGQFCIDLKLSAAFRGEVDKGLFFRGKDPLPFGDAIRSVRELLDYLTTGVKPDLNVRPA